MTLVCVLLIKTSSASTCCSGLVGGIFGEGGPFNFVLGCDLAALPDLFMTFPGS